MFDKLKEILARVDADYADVRYETKKTTSIVFNGRELGQVGTNSADGYVLRVLKDGGFSSVTFTRPESADEAVKTAMENATLIGKNRSEPIRLEKTEPVRDTFLPEMNGDPREISIEEKLELARRYNDIPLSKEKIVNTTTAYGDTTRGKFFLSTEGSEIREDLVTTRLTGEIIAKDGPLVQNVRFAAGGSDGYQNVLEQEDYVEKRTAIALDLLEAEPNKGGRYDCVLNPSLAGVFAHEAFGHFSEADIIEMLPAMRKKMQLGTKIGSDVVSITDDATKPGQLGFYKYDDEGVPVRRTPLIENGVLTGRLHSRRTAAEFGEPLSGHAVAEDFCYAPIVRMGTIYIEPGDKKFEELLETLGDGLYLCDAKGGQTAGENFSFGAQYGYIVKNGKKAGMVRDINISGNLYQTLKDIAAVGEDFVLSRAGGCGKGQMNPRSCHGGPHVLIKNLVVGGV